MILQEKPVEIPEEPDDEVASEEDDSSEESESSDEEVNLEQLRAKNVKPTTKSAADSRNSNLPRNTSEDKYKAGGRLDVYKIQK